MQQRLTILHATTKTHRSQIKSKYLKKKNILRIYLKLIHLHLKKIQIINKYIKVCRESLQMVTSAMKLKDACSLEEKL